VKTRLSKTLEWFPKRLLGRRVTMPGNFASTFSSSAVSSAEVHVSCASPGRSAS
jgi:hypothetical protein